MAVHNIYVNFNYKVNESLPKIVLKLLTSVMPASCADDKPVKIMVVKLPVVSVAVICFIPSEVLVSEGMITLALVKKCNLSPFAKF